MNLPQEHRKIKLFLTERMAAILNRILHRERRRREKDAANSGYVPEPGRFDVNLMRVSVLTDIVDQLETQLPKKLLPFDDDPRNKKASIHDQLRDREARMWLCRMYHMRGMDMGGELWKSFSAFCEAHPALYLDEPTPGKRVDGRDSWRVHFGL